MYVVLYNFKKEGIDKKLRDKKFEYLFFYKWNLKCYYLC